MPALSAIQMVGGQHGWAVGAYAIFATSDGVHWTRQLASTEQFVGVDFISNSTGWAVGVRTLMGTTDGGHSWHQLGEPSAPIRSLHFISPLQGWGIAGGGNLVENHGWLLPTVGGALVTTSDGGMSWTALSSPADAETVCFSDSGHGWLATAEGVIYRSADAGRSWTSVYQTAVAGPANQENVLECAAPSAVWLESTIENGAAGHLPYVAYTTTDASHWRAVMAEPTTTGNLLPGTPAGPGSHPASFSVVDPMDAVFVGDDPAAVSSRCVVATNGGAILHRTGFIANSSETFGAAFISVTTGWVLTGDAAGDYVIDVTSDGGFHWTLQLAVAPNSAG